MIVYEKTIPSGDDLFADFIIKYLPILHGIAIKVVYFTISNRSTN